MRFRKSFTPLCTRRVVCYVKKKAKSSDLNFHNVFIFCSINIFSCKIVKEKTRLLFYKHETAQCYSQIHLLMTFSGIFAKKYSWFGDFLRYRSKNVKRQCQTDRPTLYKHADLLKRRGFITTPDKLMGTNNQT